MCMVIRGNGYFEYRREINTRLRLNKKSVKHELIRVLKLNQYITDGARDQLKMYQCNRECKITNEDM